MLCEEGLHAPGAVASSSRATKRRNQAIQIEQADSLQVLPGRTRLETLKVGPATRRLYLMSLWLLASWVMGYSEDALNGDPLYSLTESLVLLKSLEGDDAQLDDILAGYLDEAYWLGAHSGLGGRLLSALGWLLPRFQRQGQGHLPRLHQARTAAAKRSPGLSRLPQPEPVVLATAMAMAYLLCARSENLDPVLAFVLSHHCYLRPGEAARVRWRFIVDDLQVTGRMVVTLHPAERRVPSKTGEYDETIAIDLPWLVRALRERKCQVPTDSLLLPGGPRGLQRLYDEAQLLLRTEPLFGRQTLYVLRHSGASSDTWLRRRSLDEVQKRGRWRSETSVRRYDKGGRLAELLSRCPSALLTFAASSERMLGAVLGMRCRPLRPP